MRSNSGFTLLELSIATAIIGVLATLSYEGYQSSLEKSNFRNMQEFGSEMALSQQLHRQRYGRYSQNIASNGTTNANRLVMQSADQYKITVTRADFRGYSARIQAHASDPLRLPDNCKILIVESDMGIQRFRSRSGTNQDTSSRCIPHG